MYAATPAVRPFILQAIGRVKEQASCYDDTRTGFFSRGLDVDHWLEYPDETPDASYLLSSPVSYPLIFLCQIANYLSIFQDGMDPRTLLRHTHSATGFSSGIMAAALCSLNLSLDELCRRALQLQSLFVWAGIRVQQCTSEHQTGPGAQSGLHGANAGGSGWKATSCMATISGLTRHRLAKHISCFAGPAVTLAYKLSPSQSVIAGMPDDLAAFRTFLREQAERFSWRYVPSTTAAHSPYHSRALATTTKDAGRLGLQLRGEDMQVPVWSVGTGHDLRSSASALSAAVRGYLLDTGDWRKQIAPVVETQQISHVLDFGPGTGIASLTEHHADGSGATVIRCSLPLGRSILRQQVLPSLA